MKEVFLLAVFKKTEIIAIFNNNNYFFCNFDLNSEDALFFGGHLTAMVELC